MFLDAAGFPLEYLDEFVADDLALLLGIGDAFEFAKKAVGGVDGVEVQAELVAQGLLYFLEFVFAQHAVVDENAGQARLAVAVAHCAIDEGGCDRGVYAAGERADGASGSNFFFHLFDR